MRIKRISPDEMTPEQRAVYDANVASKRGRMPAPTYAWIHSPEMARTMQPLGAFLRYDSTLGARLPEVAILVTARQWDAHYEWYAHKTPRDSWSMTSANRSINSTGCPHRSMAGRSVFSVKRDWSN
jgi:hypothetical protein